MQYLFVRKVVKAVHHHWAGATQIPQNLESQQQGLISHGSLCYSGGQVWDHIHEPSLKIDNL